jgi:hypothetical protein
MREKVKLADKIPRTRNSAIKNENLSFGMQKTDLSSFNLSAGKILFLQNTIGNQAVQRLFKSGIIQAKLKIGQPNDFYEQEADRVAEQVMRMPATSMQLKPT